MSSKRKHTTHISGASTIGRTTNGAIARAYWAGRLDQKAEAEKLLNLAARTNNSLWTELLRLDHDYPVGGTGVILSYAFCEHLVGLLRETRRYRVANKLARQLEESQRTAKELLAKLEQYEQDLDE